MDLVENKSGEKILNRHPWEVVRFSIIEEKVKTMYDKFNGKDVVLVDIGCGDSYVVSSLSTKFKFEEIYGVDINFNDEIIGNLTKQYNNINFINSLDKLNVKKSSNYIFLLNDVIEHIENDIDFLQYLKNNIFNSLNHAFLFITVPAFNFAFSKHDIDLGHYRRYNKQNLVDYNQILKMSISQSGYFFILPLFARIISKIFTYLFKRNSNKIGVTDWNSGPFITNLIILVLKVDYYISRLTRNIFPGLSTYIIYKM